MDSFFFNDTATTEIYTLSLHDALPILAALLDPGFEGFPRGRTIRFAGAAGMTEYSRELTALGLGTLFPSQSMEEDRKSTRLNSSHANISYAVFCLKKKKIIKILLAIDT